MQVFFAASRSTQPLQLAAFQADVFSRSYEPMLLAADATRCCQPMLLAAAASPYCQPLLPSVAASR